MFREPDKDLSQGDIIDGIPHARLKPPLQIVRRITVRGNREQWAPFPYPPLEGETPDADKPGKTIKLPPFNPKQGEYVPVLCQFTRGIVLNYDCDLQHEEGECLIAIVRPLTAVHDEDRETIRQNRNFNHFYLPAKPDLGLDDAYVDFRRMTCIDPELIDVLGTRLASLTQDGVVALHAQLFRFLTRRDLIA